MDTPPTPASPAATARPAFAGAASTGVRRAVPTRRVPTTTLNYDYLRHDITLLAILAPVMIIAVVIAYIILH